MADRAEGPAQPNPPGDAATPTATVAPPAPAGTASNAGPRRPRSGKRRWGQTFQSLENRDFRNLWLGMLLLMGAMQMQMVVRGYYTYFLTDSPVKLGLVTAGFALPMLILSLFGGAVADRLERKLIIQLGQVGAGLIAVFVAVSITIDNITWVHLLAASMLQGAVFSFMMPARQAIIPQLVGQELLTNAMALNAMGMSVTTLLAPALAGTLYALLGPQNVYYIMGGMCLGSVLFTSRVPKLPNDNAGRRAAMFRDIGAGLAYIRSSPVVMVLLLIGLFTAVLAMPFRFLLPVFVVDIYQRGPEAMGLLVSFMGLGSVVGSIIIAALGNWNRGQMLLLATFITGLALLLVAVLPFYYVAAGLMVLLGLGDAGRRTLNQSLIMEVTEPQYRGRVMSVFMLNFALIPLGSLPAGVAIKYLGGQWAVGILAGLLLTAGLVFAVTQKRIRDLR